MTPPGSPQAQLPVPENSRRSRVDQLVHFLGSWQKLLAAIGGVILAAGGLFAAIRSFNSTSSISTADVRPSCGPSVTETLTVPSRTVQNCSLTPGTILVFDSPDKGSAAQQVGTLQGGDSRNWFVGQARKSKYVSDARTNHWWAFTLTDAPPGGHSQWGWVPETFFQGGAHDEPAVGLALCDTKGRACNR
jgi:hypothetical protein